MKFGVVIFPGSNCDEDLIHVLKQLPDAEIVKLWHKDTDLKQCDFIFLPGGFSFGDYLRCGAIAKFSPIMNSIINYAQNGGFLMGICNGFQILCESGLLPGALLRNENQKFKCENTFLKCENQDTAITNAIGNHILKIPIAHGEGRYFADEQTMKQLEQNNQILFKYCDIKGNINDEANPNGSLNNIAGICNKNKNIFGMMPHPERCASKELYNNDGINIFHSIVNSLVAN